MKVTREQAILCLRRLLGTTRSGMRKLRELDEQEERERQGQYAAKLHAIGAPVTEYLAELRRKGVADSIDDDHTPPTSSRAMDGVMRLWRSGEMKLDD